MKTKLIEDYEEMQNYINVLNVIIPCILSKPRCKCPRVTMICRPIFDTWLTNFYYNAKSISIGQNFAKRKLVWELIQEYDIFTNSCFASLCMRRLHIILISSSFANIGLQSWFRASCESYRCFARYKKKKRNELLISGK